MHQNDAAVQAFRVHRELSGVGGQFITLRERQRERGLYINPFPRSILPLYRRIFLYLPTYLARYVHWKKLPKVPSDGVRPVDVRNLSGLNLDVAVRTRSALAIIALDNNQVDE